MNLNFLYTAISWVLLRWHDVWGAAFGTDSGVSWALSIVFLVVTVRLVLFPLFVKQIHSQRKMQELQPQVKELQKKYKNDKETMQRELMKLYRENKANPVAGCLPLALQAPVFLSLFHVLRRLDPTRAHDKTVYGWTTQLFDSASRARIFGAPISAHFSSNKEYLNNPQIHASGGTVKLVTGVLVAIMIVTTYITQRQLMAKQTQTMDSQQQMIQRIMLYGIPASLLISGSLFPLGVVLYWCTTNLWSMGQQFYVLKRMPQPGTKPKTAEEVRAELTGDAATARALAPRPGARPTAPRRSPSTGQQRRSPAGRPGRSRKGGRR